MRIFSLMARVSPASLSTDAAPLTVVTMPAAQTGPLVVTKTQAQAKVKVASKNLSAAGFAHIGSDEGKVRRVVFMVALDAMIALDTIGSAGSGWCLRIPESW